MFVDLNGLAPYINGVYDGPYKPDYKSPEVEYGPKAEEPAGSMGSGEHNIPNNSMPSYSSDYGIPTDNPYDISGAKMGEMNPYELITIEVSFDDSINLAGATKGTLTVYQATYLDVKYGSIGKTAGKYPIVSGGKGFEKTPSGIWEDVIQELTSTSLNPLLYDSDHGGKNNTMIRLEGTGGDAIHQGNKKVRPEYAYTKGCTAIVGDKKNDAEQNYQLYKTEINKGRRIDVKIK